MMFRLYRLVVLVAALSVTVPAVAEEDADSNWANFKSVAQTLEIGPPTHDEIRFFLELGLVYPFQMFRISNTGNSAYRVNEYYWWPIFDEEEKAVFLEHAEDSCGGPVMVSSGMIACRAHCSASLTGKAPDVLGQLVTELMDSAGVVRWSLEDDDNTIRIVADGETAIFQLGPTYLNHEVLVPNPGYCEVPVCATVQTLRKGIEHACEKSDGICGN